MILFRAINDNDVKNIASGQNIMCSLYNTNLNNEHKYYILAGKYHKHCIKGKLGNALDTTIGHVLGKKTANQLSCWISASSDFEFLAYEYAIPQNGNYNVTNHRKPIIVIDVDDKEIMDKNNYKICDRNQIFDYNAKNLVLNLSNNIMRELYKLGILDNENHNINLPGYNWIKAFNAELDRKRLTREEYYSKYHINGISGFAKGASEFLFYYQIKNECIKYILNPLFQDILYAMNIDSKYIEKCIDSFNIFDKAIQTAYNDFSTNQKNLFNSLYPNHSIVFDPKFPSASNLTDILTTRNITDVINDYKNIKDEKRELLKMIIIEINNLTNSHLNTSNIRLVDDKIHTAIYDQNNKGKLKVEKSIRFDIVLLQEGNKIYKLDKSKDKYIAITNPNFTISANGKNLVKKISRISKI